MLYPSKDTELTIGEVIRRERYKRDITLKQLQLLSGVNYKTINTYETGTHKPSFELGCKILLGLGLSIDEVASALYKTTDT